MHKKANLVNTTKNRIYPMPDVNRLNILAGLIAEKRMRMRLDANAKTAYINIRTSEITIPYWDVPGEMFRMLVSHECAHGIWTSIEKSNERIHNLDVSKFWKSIAHSIHNVCEDVRIDKNIQNKLTGLKTDYRVAASLIRESPLFNPEKVEEGIIEDAMAEAIGNLKEEETSRQSEMNEKFKKMSTFINACNIYYKTRWDGKSAVPKFDDAKETVFFKRMDGTVTEDQVYDLSEEIIDYFLDANYAKDKERDNESLTEFLKMLLQMLSSDSGEKVNINAQNGNHVGSGDGESIDESNLTDEQKEILRQIKEKMQAASESMTGPSDGYKKGEVSAGTGGGEGEGSGGAGSLSQHSTVNGYERIYVEGRSVDTTIATAGEIKTGKLFVTAAMVANHYEDQSSNVVDDVRHNITSLVRGFELHKKSEELRKTSYKNTGRLSTRKLHSYKTVENIFRTNEIEYVGDNYGFYVFIDYSGSMSNKVRNVTEHAYIMATFFKRINVPFRFFSVGLKIDVAATGIVKGAEFGESYYGNGNVYELFSSDQSRNQINKVYNGMMSDLKSGKARLGGTPLSNTMMTVRHSVDEFLASNDIAKFSAIAITDGGDDLGQVSAIQDSVTGAMFQSKTGYYYGHMIKLYKDLFKASFVAIDLEKQHEEGVDSEYTAQYNLSSNVIKDRSKYMEFAKEFMHTVL